MEQFIKKCRKCKLETIFDKKKSNVCSACKLKRVKKSEKIHDAKKTDIRRRNTYINKCLELGISGPFTENEHNEFWICRVCNKKTTMIELKSRNSMCYSCKKIKKEELKIKEKQYAKTNAEKIKIKRKKYTKKMTESRKSDPVKRIHHSVSCSIRKVLRGNKNCSISKYINIKELTACIESKFDWWMSWDNWGVYNAKIWDDNDSSTWTWQLDHIIPQSELPYYSTDHPNFKKCWALENLRPLSAKANITDGANKTRHKKAA
jgi:hypothetical protein